MRVMILAAGRGERLRPLTDHTPKPLIEVAGQPLLVHQLHHLVALGVSHIVINTAWLGEQLEAALGDGGRYGCSIQYSREAEALETAGGIVQALPLLGEAPFGVVNGDIFCRVKLTQLSLAPEQLAHLVLVPNPSHHQRGDFYLRDGLAACEGEEGESRYTFAGIGLYRPELFVGLRAGKRPLAPLLMAAAAEGRVAATLYEGLWCDVGTLERLNGLERSLAGTEVERENRLQQLSTLPAGRELG
ncbi:nucleotidyltransferase family protein [Ectothiorhodospiraceae bacterium BW-2]|nr:nucleotidyltransferase family protein [Ectothiorhodospiraceae bacterium BW-2]